jgi:hypothetical protein
MTASNLALIFKASACASRCGWRISDLCFGPLMVPTAWDTFSARTTPRCRGYLHTALRYSSLCIPCFSIPPSATDGPSPMQPTGACRLRGSSSPCSLSSPISGVCLTVQKRSVRMSRYEETLPQYCKSTSESVSAAHHYALHRRNITRLCTPCSSYCHSSTVYLPLHSSLPGSLTPFRHRGLISS